MNIRRYFLPFSLLSCLSLFSPLVLAQPQATATPPPTAKEASALQELLQEVKQLRQAFQHITITTQRSQMLAEKILRYEGEVEYLTERVEDERQEIAAEEQQLRTEREPRVKELEAQLNSLPPAQREDRNNSLIFAKVEKESAERQLAAKREKALLLEAKLRRAQQRLADTQAELSVLERQMEPYLKSP